MRLEGAVALVSGANRGLGRALCLELVERGARRVYAGARDPGTVTDAGVEAVALDITDPDSIAAAANRCADVTLLVNNAGIAKATPLDDPAVEQHSRELMETNYFGTLNMCRAFTPVLAQNGGGAVVNMLSIVSFFAPPGMSGLSASKAALWSLTNGMRMELRDQGTQVTAAHATFIDTDMSAMLDVPKQPAGEVAAAILDAVAADRDEVLVDERTRAVKAALSRDLELIYPEVEQQWREAAR